LSEEFELLSKISLLPTLELTVGGSVHLKYSLKFFVRQVIRLSIGFDTLRELVLQIFVLELVCFRVKEAFKWVLVLSFFLGSVLGSFLSLKLGNWVSFKPFLGELRLPLNELSSELNRFVTSVDFSNLSVFLTTAISNTINIFLGSFFSTVNLEFVRFSTDPKVDSVPAVKHHNIIVDKVLLSEVDNFFAEEETRTV